MADVKTQDFFAASQASVLDPVLRRALIKVGTGFDGSRRDAIQEITPQRWEEWREDARRIKAHTMDHLDYYLDLLEQNVAKAGGQVHFAADAAQANAIVAQIAQSRGVKVVTKSKSMVSEELSLNPVLESVGVDVFETDLGEYIIQLAGETPSHLVAPALHKTKEQVSQLFYDKLGLPYLESIEDLARAAREVLRQKFLDADMGISGANFLVAETGTLVIITNEGNGRLCTSAPRIHVGITGMEKVIPSLRDLAVFLRLLPRSATGQRISSYVSMVTGPRRASDEDGPEEFHLVLVDNGRSTMLADPELREALYCIRCGACLNICPVYKKGGRPRLRLGIPWPNRSSGFSISGRIEAGCGVAPGFQFVRGLPGGVSGKNQHPQDAAPPAERVGGKPRHPRSRRHRTAPPCWLVDTLGL